MPEQDNHNLSTTTTTDGDHLGSVPFDDQGSTFAPIHIQDASPFFTKFPQELRDMIYYQVFAFTRLTHGLRWDTRQGPLARMKPAPNSLALLRTCRRVMAEVGDRWLRHVMFDFQDPFAMIQKLSPLPKKLITQIRHIRVNVERLCVPVEDECLDYHNVVHAIKMLPGLKLDVLTIQVDLPANWSYHLLNKLIRHAGGWKELRFLSPTSEMLGHNDHEEESFLRLPQPAQWQGMLECQDGVESLPSVVVYRAKVPFGARVAKAGVMQDPSQWEAYEQTETEADSDQHYGERIDQKIMLMYGERNKEMVVIARRGKGADYQENWAWSYPQYADELRESVAAWIEDRKGWLDRRWLRCEHGIPVGLGTPPRDEKIIDGVELPYTHVDEYEWNQNSIDDLF